MGTPIGNPLGTPVVWGLGKHQFVGVTNHSFLKVRIHASSKQKVEGKRSVMVYEPVREQNAFHVTYILPILRLEYFYPNLETQQLDNYSK